MRSSRAIRRTIAAAAAVIGLVVAGATPAQAATFEWLNARVKPDGKVYSDTQNSSSWMFTRTGVEAWIDKSNGPYWETKVWFGGYSTTGETLVSITGPRSTKVTKASFKYLPGNTGSGTSDVHATLLGAKLSGTYKMSDSMRDEPALSASEASVTATDLRAGRFGDLDLESVGQASGVSYWAGATTDGHHCLYAVHGEYLAKSCTDAASFAENGLVQDLEGPGINVRARLVSEAGSTVKRAPDQVQVSSRLFVTAGSPQPAVP